MELVLVLVSVVIAALEEQKEIERDKEIISFTETEIDRKSVSDLKRERK